MIKKCFLFVTLSFLSYNTIAQNIELDTQRINQIENEFGDNITLQKGISNLKNEEYEAALQFFSQVNVNADIALGYSLIYLKAYGLYQLDKVDLSCKLWNNFYKENEIVSNVDSTINKTCENNNSTNKVKYIAPEFYYGKDSMLQLLQMINYPIDLYMSDEKYNLTATFYIDKEGELTSYKIDNNFKNKNRTDLIKEKLGKIFSLFHQFRPARLNGEAIDSSFQITFHFEVVIINDKNEIDGLQKKLSETADIVILMYRTPISSTSFTDNSNKDNCISCDNLNKKADEFYNIGTDYLERGKYKLALEYFDKSISIRHLKDAYYNRAACHFYRNNIEKACEDWFLAGVQGDEESIKLYIQYCK